MVPAAITAVCVATFFLREAVVVVRVFTVRVTAFATLSFFAASVLVAASCIWALLLSVAVPVPPLLLFLSCFSSYVRVHV